jgi:hypothetical protein
VIPSRQIIEITELPTMAEIRRRVGRDRPTLEQSCGCLGIDCSHKEIMNNRSRMLQANPMLRRKAEQAAIVIQGETGWSPDFCQKRALEKICGGTAILEAFNEFVKSGGDANADFYVYAIGDVIAENNLFLRLNR